MNAVVVARLWTSRLRTAIVSWRSEEMGNRFVAADVVIYDIHRPAGSDGPETFYSVFFYLLRLSFIWQRICCYRPAEI